MKLTTTCPSCNKNLNIKSWAATRPDLEMEKGDEFNINCKHCGITTKKHVNEISAKPNFIVVSLGVLIGLIAVVLLWNFGFISSLSAAIPVLFWQQENKAVKTFNSYTIKRKTS